MSKLIDVESIEFQHFLRSAIADALDESLAEFTELVNEMITKVDKDYTYFRNSLALDIAMHIQSKKK